MDQSGYHRQGDENNHQSNVYGDAEVAIRLFRSSPCGMFRESQISKTDACALFCCGIYLWQRNKDLFTRELRKEDVFIDHERPSILTSTETKTRFSAIVYKRLDVSILSLIVVTIVIWSFEDPTTNRPFSTIVLGANLMLVTGALWRFFEFQRGRKKFRRQLAIVEYYRRRLIKNNENRRDPGLDAFLERHRQEIDGDRAHDLFGCVKSNDDHFGCCRLGRYSHESQGSISNDENSHCNEFCFGASRLLSNLCCGVFCGHQLQLCGMCAIAQESRYLQGVISATSGPGFWQRDYVTMQPWMEYYPSILRLRLSNQSHCLPHFNALSKLSSQILISTIASFFFVTTLFLFPIRFPKWQVLILYGTFLQPVFFLVFVHWMWNRLDLSLDAVVKYFACGFVICTSSALVYEFLASKVAQKFVMLVDRLGSEGLVLFGDDTNNCNYVDHPIWYKLTLVSLTAFTNAFFVAGMTEEVCKYLCFWMVEHPDLVFQNRVLLPISSARIKVKELSTKNAGHDDPETTRLLSHFLPSDHKLRSNFESPAPFVSIGEAITVAMVSVALGFACAENLLYIFVYTSPIFSAEISTLYVRCLFPIHPMAAALQSIGVCRRDLEKDSSVGIGRILFPAWLLHGFFDFILMAHSAVKKVSERHEINSNNEPAPTNAPAFSSENREAANGGEQFLLYMMIVPFIAMIYFLNESLHQRERLEQLDKK